MSDINEEQKRLYKRAEENDYILKEIHNLREQNKDLQKQLDFMIEQNDKKEDRINKAIEYIEERFDYVLKDESFLSHDDLAERRIALYLLNILKGDNK